MKRIVLGLGLFLLANAPVQAAIPSEALNNEYESCIGDGHDASRNAYCACVRDEMRSWSEDDFMEVAKEMAVMKSGSPPPAKLARVAEQCISKTLSK